MSGETGVFKMYTGAGAIGTRINEQLSDDGTSFLALPSGSTVAATFLPVGTTTQPPSYDDFGLVSTGDITVGGTTIPAGSAIVNDSGHAGCWEIGARSNFSGAGLTGNFSIEVSIYINDVILDDADWAINTGGALDINDVSLDIIPLRCLLADGDVVWMGLLSSIPGAGTLFASDFVLTMKFCGTA